MSNDANPAAEYLQSAETPDQPLTETAAASGPPSEDDKNSSESRHNGSGGVWTLPGRSGFVKGNPGRPKGVKNKRTELKDAFLEWVEAGDPALKLPPQRERIAKLLVEADPATRAMLEVRLVDHRFGKPQVSMDVTHHGEVVEEAKEHLAGRIWDRPKLVEKAS